MASTSILEYLSALSAGGAHADIILVARTEDGSLKELPSHLPIIARSRVFERMLSGPFVEGLSKRVEILVKQDKHLQVVRECLYTDRMSFDDDWTANDFVEVMALCDRYELPAGGRLASKELMNHYDAASLSEAIDILEHMSTALNDQNLLQDALNKLAPKVVFGYDVVRSLLWLLKFQRRTCARFDSVRDEILKRVGEDEAELAKELDMEHDDADVAEVRETKIFVTAFFLNKVSASLPMKCHADETRPCWSCRARVTFHTTTVVNTRARPALLSATKRLLDDMSAVYEAKGQPAASLDEALTAKRRRLETYGSGGEGG